LLKHLEYKFAFSINWFEFVVLNWWGPVSSTAPTLLSFEAPTLIAGYLSGSAAKLLIFYRTTCSNTPSVQTL
jgi:hypothetical protein